MKKKLQTAFSPRQYMISQDFEIYYYSDKTVKSVPGHRHNYYEFYFFLGGEILMEIDGRSFSPRSGDMILIPPGIPHHVKILNSELFYQRFIFWISREYYDQLIQLSPDYGYLPRQTEQTGTYLYHFDIFSFHAIQSRLFQLIEELNSERFGKAAKLTLSVCDLLFFLNRSIYEAKHLPRPKEENSLYQNLLAYIQEHLEEDLSLDRLSKVFFVSKYHISHIFKQNLGISLHQYILKKRLAMSRDAILGRSEISEAALLYGFKDYSSFYKAFCKEYGLSPKEYRRQYVGYSQTSSGKY